FDSIKGVTKEENLYFYDAAAPIVTLESVDMSSAYRASRYGKGDDDYINCPMNEQEYKAFWNELVNAGCAEISSVDKEVVFEGCMPVETMAKRGEDTLLFGPLKPVGLPDPKTGKDPYAVVQLRQDNASGTLYNLVGFQTHLKWGEQKRVFGMIPALKNAEFVRYGVMHRNTFINSPELLDAKYMLRGSKNIYFAGQMTGVEGYIESASSGFVAGLNLAMTLLGKDEIIFPDSTATGALSHYVSSPAVKNFQPMNVNFGIMEPLGMKIRKKQEKNLKLAEKALGKIEEMKL
ncbi:MAG: methylenetetrahydrofolate--tRNA-(uracil(54)-C(5))-methyltransferase (FADH(2)-oxidizing) TrmFO, partial [Clostridia bacterium]|nr:methylenetetrahydrofolate--tRNA-(uracil(54)-C(5))-methyltransferase (FADH(2)-oxidizing) TrmFO [Clostridia bacterium]